MAPCDQSQATCPRSRPAHLLVNAVPCRVRAQLGPAPSWTSPLAIVRYPLFPVGIQLDTHGEVAGDSPARETSDGPTFFSVTNMSRVQRLLHLQVRVMWSERALGERALGERALGERAWGSARAVRCVMACRSTAAMR